MKQKPNLFMAELLTGLLALMLMMLCSCKVHTAYNIRAVTYYKYDSIKTRDYMLVEKRWSGLLRNNMTELLIEPEMMLLEEKIIYDSLLNQIKLINMNRKQSIKKSLKDYECTGYNLCMLDMIHYIQDYPPGDMITKEYVLKLINTLDIKARKKQPMI